MRMQTARQNIRKVIRKETEKEAAASGTQSGMLPKTRSVLLRRGVSRCGFMATFTTVKSEYSTVDNKCSRDSITEYRIFQLIMLSESAFVYVRDVFTGTHDGPKWGRELFFFS